MELPFLVKTSDLFVHLNVHFRSYQFEEVRSRAVNRLPCFLEAGETCLTAGFSALRLM